MSVLPHYERMLREYKCCTPKELVLTVKSNLPKALSAVFILWLNRRKNRMLKKLGS